MANPIATLRIELEAGVGRLAADLQKAETLIGRSARAFENFGYTITTKFTIPATIGMAKVLKAFSDFDQAITNSMSYFGKTLDTGLRKQMELVAEEMSTKTRYSAAELAGAYNALASAGLEVAEAMSALPVVARLAQAENTNLITTTEKLMQVQMAMGLRIKDNADQNAFQMQRIADTFARVSAMTVTNIDRLMSAALTRAATEAFRFKASVEELGAALGVLAERGIEGEKAGYNLGVVFRDLAVKGAEFSKEFEKFGVPVFDKQTGQIRKFGDILTDLKKIVGEVKVASNEVFSSTEKTMELLTDKQKTLFLRSLHLNQRNLAMLMPLLTGNALERYKELLNELQFNKEGAVQKMVDIQMQSFENRMLVLRNRLLVLMKDIGQEISEPFYKIASIFVNLAETFRTVDPEIRSMIYSLTALIAVTGPLSWGFGIVLKSISQFLFIVGKSWSGLGTILILPFSLLKEVLSTGNKMFAPFLSSIMAASQAMGGGFIPTVIALGKALGTLILGLVTSVQVWFLAAAAIYYYRNEIADAINEFESKLSGTNYISNKTKEDIAIVQESLAGLESQFKSIETALGVPLVIKLNTEDLKKLEADLGIVEIAWATIKQIFEWMIVGADFTLNQLSLLFRNILGTIFDGWVAGLVAIYDYFSNWTRSIIDLVLAWFPSVKEAFLSFIPTTAQVKAKLDQVSSVISSWWQKFGNWATGTDKGFWGGIRENMTGFALEDRIAAEKSKNEGLLGGKSSELIEFIEKQKQGAKGLAQVLGKELPEGYAQSMDSAMSMTDALDLQSKLTSMLTEDTKAATKAEKEREKQIRASESALESFQKQLTRSEGKSAVNKLEDSISEALKQGNLEAAGDLVDKYREAVKTAYIDGHSAGLKKVLPEEQAKAKQMLEEAAEYEADLREKAMEESVQKRRLELEKQTVDFWRNAMENAITGVTFDWKDSLKQVGIGFAADFAASFFGVMDQNITSLKDLGSSIFKQTIGDSIKEMGKPFMDMVKTAFTDGVSMAMDGLKGILSDIFGDVMSGAVQGAAQGATSGAVQSGVSGTATGVATSGGMWGLIAVAVAAYTYFEGRKMYELAEAYGGGYTTNEERAWKIGQVVGDRIFPYLGTFVYMVGNNLGLINKGMEADRAAREKLENAIEGRLAEYAEVGGGLPIFTPEGMRNMPSNFSMGPYEEKIVGGEWAEEYTQGPNYLFFDKFGLAFKELLGISEEVAPQIGYLLQQNLAGNLDNAKLLMDAMGISLEDMTNALLETAMAGEISWHEFISAMNEFDKVAKEGLVDTANVRGAFDQLAASGGRGAMALQAVKNIAIEAGEAGVSTLEELKQWMLESGQFTTEEINQIYDAMAGAGITSMEELKAADERLLATVVANLETQKFAWDDLNSSIDESVNKTRELDERLNEINDKELTVDLVFKARVEGEVPEGGGDVVKEAMGGVHQSGLKRFASGGIVDFPKLFRFGAGGLGRGLMGEAGPEAILPLQRINGRLGVFAKVGGGTSGDQFVFNIDARNAAPGVEVKLARMIRAEARQAVYQAVALAREQRRREGY